LWIASNKQPMEWWLRGSRERGGCCKNGGFHQCSYRKGRRNQSDSRLISEVKLMQFTGELDVSHK
jgi:hypothetical protein